MARPVSLPTLVNAVPGLAERGIRRGVRNTAHDLRAHPKWALYAGAAVGGYVAVKSAFFIRRERRLDAIESKLDETLDVLEEAPSEGRSIALSAA